MPSQCPGEDGECISRTCLDGRCGFAKLDVEVQSQIAGDCLRRICDDGATVEVIGDDAPDDGNECTIDACSLGAPTHEPSPEGARCGLGDETHCNGAGQCVGCQGDGDCPAGSPCASFTCVDESCVLVPAPAGTTCGDGGACAGGIVSLPDQCDGEGACVDGGTESCAPYACAPDGKACRIDCFEPEECCCGNECYIPGLQGYGECVLPGSIP